LSQINIRISNVIGIHILVIDAPRLGLTQADKNMENNFIMCVCIY